MYFSIIVPLYNKEYSIEKCLRSVLAQTYKHYELIIVNDGATDNSDIIVKKTIEGLDNVKYIYQKNKGVSAARNKGVKSSKYDLICFLDADDEWKTSFLETLAALINDFPNADLYALAHMVKKSGAEPFKPKHGLPDGYRGYVEDFFKASSKGSVLNSSKACVRKKSFLTIGGFPEGVTAGEDLYVWIQMALNGTVACDVSYLSIVNQVEDFSRSARKNSVPYPIIFFSKNKMLIRNKSLDKYLFLIFIKHFIYSLKSLKFKEAALRTYYYSKIFI
ncbi:glycosyltransferase family 2 protein [Advenella alkanexedens]|uniref:Glycosyltransferase family 2 protein n=1 Tax=Advenella alkanexedens TaxID=1481665 RepID=A0ABS6NKE8_9BURK|nr:glycosyltransferase family A protein [Advenella alkanexedens]MBV4396111.1 glycosyltransferase family 2 protein [Advenella alkanexedens]